MSQPNRDDLFNRYVRYADWLAYRWGFGLDIRDRRQVARLGLIIAIDDLIDRRPDVLANPDEGHVGNFLRKAIRNALQQEAARMVGPVGVDAGLRHRISKAEKTLHARRISTGAQADHSGIFGAEEIAREAGVSVDRLKRFRHATASPESLSEMLIETNGSQRDETLADCIEDTSGAFPAPDAEVQRWDDQALVGDLIAGAKPALTDSEKCVLRLRYGLVDGVEHTHAEIAEAMNISIVNARQLAHQALKKLRSGLHPESQQGLPSAQAVWTEPRVKNTEAAAIWKVRNGHRQPHAS